MPAACLVRARWTESWDEIDTVDATKPLGTLTIARDSAGSVYVPDSEGRVFVLREGASRVEPVIGSTADEFITAAAVAPSDSSVQFKGTFKGLYRSQDGGETWTKLAPVGLRGSCTRIEIDALDPATLIVEASTSRERQTLFSTDGAHSFSPLPPELAGSAIAYDPLGLGRFRLIAPRCAAAIRGPGIG